jgi:hypothetical protein
MNKSGVVRTLAAAFAVWLVTGLSIAHAGGHTGDKMTGVWQSDRNFVHNNLSCMQSWHCMLTSDLPHGTDTMVVTTPNQITEGTCGAGEGTAGSCNTCVSAPPSDACEYWLEEK